MKTRSFRDLALFVLLALMGLGLTSCTTGLTAPRFITTLGTFPLPGGNTTLRLEEEGNSILYKFDSSEHIKNEYVRGDLKYTLSPSKRSIKKGSNWFVFPVSADEVWIYEGGDDLTLYTSGGPFGGDPESHVFIVADPTHNIVKRAPKEVRDRLPRSLKDKYGVD